MYYGSPDWNLKCYRPFHQLYQTSCSSDGWFDLTEIVEGTVALAGTAKARFIYIYIFFDLSFYVSLSSDEVRS